MVAALPEARGFALAGGGALVVHGLTERSTNDLDFFTPAPTDVPVLRQALEIAFREAGLTVAIVRGTETFVRLAVGDGMADTLVGLAWDVRLRPAVASDFGPVLDKEELGPTRSSRCSAEPSRATSSTSTGCPSVWAGHASLLLPSRRMPASARSVSPSLSTAWTASTRPTSVLRMPPTKRCEPGWTRLARPWSGVRRRNDLVVACSRKPTMAFRITHERSKSGPLAVIRVPAGQAGDRL